MTNQTTLIGISGRKRHGKNTVATMIKDELLLRGCHRSIVELAFAGALKQDVANQLGISVYELDQDKVRYRPLLQEYGTMMRHTRGDTYWLNRLHVQLAKQPFGSVVIITDCRFPNEADFVRQHSGTVVKVVRAGLDDTDTHASETEVDKIDPDYAITNNKGLNQLYSQVTATLDAILDAQDEVGDREGSVGLSSPPPLCGECSQPAYCQQDIELGSIYVCANRKCVNKDKQL